MNKKDSKKYFWRSFVLTAVVMLAVALMLWGAYTVYFAVNSVGFKP